ncbi:MAG TPA: putative metal-binding motif-containing protein [Polyangiaceae bacterium]
MLFGRRPALPFAVAAAVLAVGLGTSPARALTRCEVMTHAKKWVDAGIMYSQGPGAGYCPGKLYCDPDLGNACYRPDCSGFVSAVWHLPAPGHTTYSFATGPWDDGVSHAIAKSELEPGDALNWAGNPSQGTGHIMLFGGWIDAAQTQLWVYQESQCGTPAHYSQLSWGSVAGTYVPIRLNAIQPNGPEICNGVDDNCNGQVDEGNVCDAPPKGYLDKAGCDFVSGWVQDTDAPDKATFADLYFGGPAGKAPGIHQLADVHRDDLCAAIGSCNHGFSARTPRSLLDGKPHDVYAYGIDVNGSNNALLSDAPKSLTCPPPKPFSPAVKRHVVNPNSMTAWKIDGFLDVVHEPEATVAGLPDGDDLPGTPELVQADDGTPEVWILDGKLRRHVVSPDSMTSWHFGFGDVKKTPAAEVYAHTKGPDFPTEQLAILGDGPALYVLDAPPSPPDKNPTPAPKGQGGGGASASGTGAGGALGATSSPDDNATDDASAGSCAVTPVSRGWAGAVGLALAALARARRRRAR